MSAPGDLPRPAVGMGALLIAVPSDDVRLDRPTPGTAVPPIVTLPGGLGIIVDAGASGRAAAAWWRLLAVTAMYAADCCDPPTW